MLDLQTLFSDNQDLAQIAGTYLCSKSIDLLAAGTIFPAGGNPILDPGRSNAKLFAEVTTAFTSAGAATVQMQLVMADNGALTTNLVILASTDVIAKATLVQGYQFRLGLMPGITKQFLGVQYIIGTATTTAGKVTAGIVIDKGTNLSIG